MSEPPIVNETSQTDAPEPSHDGDDTAATPRERSTIKFPYTDIRDAVTVAEVFKDQLGSSCETGQLATALGQKVSSGSFRTKVATAAIFGVVESKRGSINLLPLGHELVDSRTKAHAMVQAFLNVELYQRLYDRYKDKTLPGDAGLEAEIRSLGVLSSQADRARQAFIRSAEHAGFFWGGKERLVMPPNVKLNGGGDAHVPDDEPDEQREAKPPKSPKLSEAPLLRALWDTLPEGPDFSTDARKRFFTALAFNIDYVYGPPKDGGQLDPMGIASLWGEKPTPRNE